MPTRSQSKGGPRGSGRPTEEGAHLRPPGSTARFSDPGYRSATKPQNSTTTFYIAGPLSGYLLCRQASDRGCPRLRSWQSISILDLAPSEPRPRDEKAITTMEENGSTFNQSAPSDLSAGVQKTTSAKKAASNRENAQKSTGPKTEEGKARSSANSYVHGFYSKRCFPTPQQWALDGAEFLALIKDLRQRFEPQDAFESRQIEKIAADYVLRARLMHHEQKILSFEFPFETRSSTSLPRLQANIERQIAKDIELLQDLQAERKAKCGSREAESEAGWVNESVIGSPIITEAASPQSPASDNTERAETKPTTPQQSLLDDGGVEHLSCSTGEKNAETKPKMTFMEFIDNVVLKDNSSEAAN